jgi:phage tail-like protein
MAALGEIGLRGDPLLAYNFVISLLDTSSDGALAGSVAMGAIFDVALGGFNECSGLEMTLDLHEQEEGGVNGYVHRFPTRVKWSNLTLKKGIGAGTGLWDWHYGFAEGKGRRRDGVIVLLNELQLPNNIWFFRRGLPVKYSGPTLNAQQNNVAIESIEIAHEGIYQVPGVGYGSAAATLGVSAAAP